MPPSRGTSPRTSSRWRRLPFAGDSTGSRSPSSSLRRASRRSVSMAWRSAWTTASGCSPEAAAWRCPVTRRCAPPSTGATSCCPNPSGWSCAGWGSSPAVSRWTKPVSSQRAPTSPHRTSRIRSRTWWASHSCRRTWAARSCTIACSRRRARTRARRSSEAPNSTTSRDATPSTIETSSSMPRRNWRRGPPPSGLLHTGLTLMTCVRPSTGPFRQAVISASAWRSPRQPCRCGHTCRCWLNVVPESSEPLQASDVRCPPIPAATCGCISRLATPSCIPAQVPPRT